MDRRTYLRVATGALGGTACVGDGLANEPRNQQITDDSLTQQAKLASGADDSFGQAAAVSDDGSTVIVGAPIDEQPNGDAAGSAYVFERAGDSWLQQAKLAPDDGDSGDLFGDEVALSSDGSTAIVGAPEDEDPNGTDAGSAYEFARTSGSWSQQNKLTPDDGDSEDKFGEAVAVSDDGSTAVVGAPRDEDPNGQNSGSAYVFDQAGAAWNQQAKLAAADGDSDDQFGRSVAVSGDGSTAIVGAFQDEDPNGTDSGSAYEFARTSGSWSQQNKLTPDDGDGDDWFGSSVAVSGDGSRVVVGAALDEDPNGTQAGSAYVFDRSGRSWTQRAKLAADDGDTEDVFGISVAVSRDGSRALVGAYQDEDPNGDFAGSAYAFEQTGGSWSQQTKLSAADGDSSDRFGFPVEISDDGSIIVVGAFNDEDPNGEDGGSAYIFETGPTTGGLPTEDPTFQEVLAVIEAFNNGEQYNGVKPGFQDVLTVIEAFNS